MSRLCLSAEPQCTLKPKHCDVSRSPLSLEDYDKTVALLTIKDTQTGLQNCYDVVELYAVARQNHQEPYWHLPFTLPQMQLLRRLFYQRLKVMPVWPTYVLDITRQENQPGWSLAHSAVLEARERKVQWIEENSRADNHELTYFEGLTEALHAFQEFLKQFHITSRLWSRIWPLPRIMDESNVGHILRVWSQVIQSLPPSATATDWRAEVALWLQHRP